MIIGQYASEINSITQQLSDRSKLIAAVNRFVQEFESYNEDGVLKKDEVILLQGYLKGGISNPYQFLPADETTLAILTKVKAIYDEPTPNTTNVASTDGPPNSLRA